MKPRVFFYILFNTKLGMLNVIMFGVAVWVVTMAYFVAEEQAQIEEAEREAIKTMNCEELKEKLLSYPVDVEYVNKAFAELHWNIRCHDG